MLRIHLIALALLIVAVPPAFAHRVLMAFASRGDQIVVEAFFEGDVPAGMAKVKVVDEVNAVVAEGLTDAKGIWTFAAPKSGDYIVHLDAGAGHRARKKLTVPIVERKSESSPIKGNAKAPSDPPTVESKEEQTSTPWGSIALGLVIIAGASAAFLLVSRIRQAAPRTE